MTEEYRQVLLDAGIDVDTALERFMENEELYIKFLKKFPQDTSFGFMQEAMRVENIEEAFKMAHTLKGVVGNLSIDNLYKQLIPFVEVLREGDMKQAHTMWQAVEKEYLLAKEAIEEKGIL